MRLAELTYFTGDIETMVNFYQRLLGVEPVARLEGMAIIKAGSMFILLHSARYIPEGELPAEDHIAFAVSNVDATAEELQNRGLTLDFPPHDYYWGRSAYLRDPEGHLVEVIQEEPPSTSGAWRVADERLEKSMRTGKPHHFLHSLCGYWQGVSRTWQDTGELSGESSATASIRPLLDGRFVVYEYANSLHEEPVRGKYTLGYDLQTQQVQAVWIDSYRLGTGMLFCTGALSENGLSMLGRYPEPRADGPEGWRTELQLDAKDQLLVSAYKIAPGGVEFKALESRYQRSH